MYNDFLLNYVFNVTVLMYKKMFRTLFYLHYVFQIMSCMFASLMVVFQSPAVCHDHPLEIGQGRDRL